jgi:hypothetical protein
MRSRGENDTPCENREGAHSWIKVLHGFGAGSARASQGRAGYIMTRSHGLVRFVTALKKQMQKLGWLLQPWALRVQLEQPENINFLVKQKKWLLAWG